MGVPYCTGILQDGSYECGIGCSFGFGVAASKVSLEKLAGVISLLTDVADVLVKVQFRI